MVEEGDRHIAETQQERAPEEVVERPVEQQQDEEPVDPGFEEDIFDIGPLVAAGIDKIAGAGCFQELPLPEAAEEYQQQQHRHRQDHPGNETADEPVKSHAESVIEENAGKEAARQGIHQQESHPGERQPGFPGNPPDFFHKKQQQESNHREDHRSHAGDKIKLVLGPFQAAFGQKIDRVAAAF